MNTAQPVTPRATATPRAITTPGFDLLCCGGLSLLVLLPIVVGGREWLPQQLVWLAIVINMPHFMASYWLLYSRRDMVKRHRWASVYVPALLIGYMVFALFMAEHTLAHALNLAVLSGGYLAWHYTGQAWGMIASFSHLGGVPFDDRERRVARATLHVLLVWHVVWFLHTGSPGFFPDWLKLAIQYAQWVMHAAALGALGVSIWVVVRVRRRTGKLLPARALVAWGALFVWYAALAIDLRALFWVQIAHALQYLLFPMRVELNRAALKGGETIAEPPSTSAQLGRGLVFFGLLVLLGLTASHLIPAMLGPALKKGISPQAALVFPGLLLAAINVHHYFTDGVIWKLSTPEVRRDLFAHLKT